MKCPYTCNIEQVNQWHYEYDDNQCGTNTEHKMLENKIFTNCIEEECGVYQDGKCNYNQGHNGD